MQRWRLATATLFGAFALLAIGISAANAQPYPSKPIRIIVPFAAGGAVDALARIISARLQESLGQPVIVENRAGAGGMTGADLVAKAPPDGYTILQNTNGQAISPAIYRTLPFDTLKDFIPVTQLVATSTVLVANPKLPAKTVQELIALAKAHPGKLNYYSVGIGSTSHLSTVLFMDVTGTKMQHVPYSQMAQGITDVLTGRTEINFGPMGSSIGNIREGKMRALALTGPVRAKLLPEVPTLTELGIKMGEESSWYAFFAPKGTPRPIIDKINRDLEKVLAMPEMKERGTQLGYRFIGGSPEKLAAHLKSEIAKWDALEKKGAFK